ncbi:MAG: DNA/RNA nuclease SfsA [Candidatus Pelagibacter sp. TMED153]|nr:MAG: DNA/RNA nuclease SfsA [Candidatus Pelagibacter sp. TMED153]|tara:strand:+ start:1822 stop:2517 length:696 start_codon:yes stop_codon:yes gene_type:complete
MNFENKLISGVFIKRYKRFFVDVCVKNKIITAHCPNTGSMQGLLKEGNKVWLSLSNNPNRKLKYTLQIIEENGSKVGINTHLTNKIVFDALDNNLIKEIDKNISIKPEVKFGDKTRFDFLVTKKNFKAFIEVKNVTLSRKAKIAEFPDAVTSRGAKHIEELNKASKKGYKIFIAFIIQREDCKEFAIAKDIDPKYSELLTKSIKKKLNILCYDCKFSSKGIKLNNRIKFKI